MHLKNGAFPLRGGRICIFPPGDAYATSSEEGVEHFFAHFDVVGLPGSALRRLFRKPFYLPEAQPLLAIVQQAAQELRDQPADLAQHWRVKAIIYESLARHLQTLSADDAQLCRQVISHVEPILPALRMIQDRPAELLDNKEMARQCHMSEDHFIRRFRECVGQTPARYALQFRLKIAAQRLLFSEQTIEEIARETGFCHRSHFTHAFQRHEGLSPAAFRRQHRKKVSDHVSVEEESLSL
jgi:AraC-like DNA-binding protein